MRKPEFYSSSSLCCWQYSLAALLQKSRKGRTTQSSPAAATDAKGKVEVTEFFWYAARIATNSNQR